VSEKVVLRVNEPEVPVTVIGKVPVAAVAEALRVNVEFALPPPGGVTGLGAKPLVTPLGNPVALRVVAALKPFRLLIVTVVVVLPPRVTLPDVGDTAIPKSGDGVVLVMLTVPVVVRVSEPLVPVTVKLTGPRGALAGTGMLKVDVLPLAGFGLNVPPAGLTESDTAPENPPVRLTLTV